MDSKSVASFITGGVGLLSATAITQEILNVVLTTLSILSIVLSIVISLVKWYNDSRKDGKITSDEIIKGAEILKDGTDEIKEALGKDDEQPKD